MISPTPCVRISFSQYWACSAIVLMMVTWPLWWPVGGIDHYPSLPWMSVLATPMLAVWLRGLSVGCGVFLFGAAVSRKSPGRWWIGVVLCLSLSFLLDQHRLQPWAYQTAIYGVVFVACNQFWERRLLSVVVASIYFYSALGKFDFQFAHTVGQEFLCQLLAPADFLLPAIDPAVATKLALVFPTIEITAAIGLLFPWCRSVAAWVLIGMHASLIAMLGPWAADHSIGVLVWNAALIGQAYLLFVRSGEWEMDQARPSTASKPTVSITAGSKPMVAMIVTGLVAMAPAGERWGFWDHWLSWSMYSPHTSRAVIQLHASSLDRLPMSLGDHILDDQDGDGWHRVSIENWSLRSRGVPVYPQARYQLELARWIATTAAIDRGIRVTYLGVSDRWTGVRDEQQLLGKRNLWE